MRNKELEKIIKSIKKVNDARTDGTTISEDDSNEEILNILSEFGVDDDADEISERFGSHGLDMIREAERGLYSECREIEVIEKEFSKKDGFAWIVFKVKESDRTYTLQACLKELEKCKNEETRNSLVNSGLDIYKQEVDIDDDGMDWGLSGDANSAAFDAFGVDACRNLFYKEIRTIGIKVR